VISFILCIVFFSGTYCNFVDVFRLSVGTASLLLLLFLLGVPIDLLLFFLHTSY
jgi:hypothetical protein